MDSKSITSPEHESKNDTNSIVQECQQYLHDVIHKIATTYSLDKSMLLKTHGTFPQLSEHPSTASVCTENSRVAKNSVQKQPLEKSVVVHTTATKEKSVKTTKPVKRKAKVEKVKGAKTPRKKSKTVKKKRTKVKAPVDPATICMARKQDGNQCTRRKKIGEDYCGKHIKNRKYGRIDEPSPQFDKKSSKGSIATKVQTLGGKEYLVDEHNIVYTKNILNPTIVGVKIAKGKLCNLDDIEKHMNSLNA